MRLGCASHRSTGCSLRCVGPFRYVMFAIQTIVSMLNIVWLTVRNNRGTGATSEGNPIAYVLVVGLSCNGWSVAGARMIWSHCQSYPPSCSKYDRSAPLEGCSQSASPGRGIGPGAVDGTSLGPAEVASSSSPMLDRGLVRWRLDEASRAYLCRSSVSSPIAKTHRLTGPGRFLACDCSHSRLSEIHELHLPLPGSITHLTLRIRHSWQDGRLAGAPGRLSEGILQDVDGSGGKATK